MPQGSFYPSSLSRGSSFGVLLPPPRSHFPVWPFCPQRRQVLREEGGNFLSCRFSFKKKNPVDCRMKVSEKMAAVEQRRGREGKEGPPLGACAELTCQKASWEMKS